MNVIEVIARRAVLRPDDPALIIEDRRMSYSDLMLNVAKVATGMRAAGVGRHDVVAILAPGLMGQIIGSLAVAHLGAVSVALIAEGGKGVALAAAAALCEVKYVVHNIPDEFHIDAPCIQAYLKLQSLLSGTYEELVPMVPTEPDDMFRIAMSSGTTGRPKAVRYTHGRVILRAQLTIGLYPGGPGDRTLVCLGAGLLFSVIYWLRTLMCGGAVVGPAGAPLEAALRHRATFLLSSPATAIDMLQMARSDARFSRPLPDLKTLCIGGSTVAVPIQEALRKHICPNIAINYGTTETGLVAVVDQDVMDIDPTSSGRLMPWVEAEVVDAQGNPLPAGEQGVLRIRSPAMANGYIGATDASKSAFRDGWFYSNDVATISQGTLVYLSGRGDVLNLSGIKVDAARVEAVVARDPAVLECVAFASPDDQGVQRLIVAVVAPDGLDEQALSARCTQAFGKRFEPAAIKIVKAFPHNEGGKILRDEVIRTFAQEGNPLGMN